jgi:hypothetical protein
MAARRFAGRGVRGCLEEQREKESNLEARRNKILENASPYP